MKREDFRTISFETTLFAYKPLSFLFELRHHGKRYQLFESTLIPYRCSLLSAINLLFLLYQKWSSWVTTIVVVCLECDAVAISYTLMSFITIS